MEDFKIVHVGQTGGISIVVHWYIVVRWMMIGDTALNNLQIMSHLMYTRIMTVWVLVRTTQAGVCR